MSKRRLPSQGSKFEPYKKWFVGVALSVIVVPCISLNWKHIQVLWASPERVEVVEKKVDKQETAQEQIAKLLLKEEARNDRQEALYKVQMENMKEQLQLIADLKREK